MKTKVTLRLDADLLRDVRRIAAEEGRSLTALVTECLESLLQEKNEFERSRVEHSRV
ncbi:MAG: hypothetical protein QOE68_2196 [Thermoanaerobaculia bacterium]|jgi:hypothetical protein|nr:hypothetical protein [Thermoanaerobaculia bacterium]